MVKQNFDKDSKKQISGGKRMIKFRWEAKFKDTTAGKIPTDRNEHAKKVKEVLISWSLRCRRDGGSN